MWKFGVINNVQSKERYNSLINFNLVYSIKWLDIF